MSAPGAWLAALWAWFVGLFDRPYRLVVNEGSFPAHQESRRIYVLTEDGDPWEARMTCPCGCGDQLDLNLLPDDHPDLEGDCRQRGQGNVAPIGLAARRLQVALLD